MNSTEELELLLKHLSVLVEILPPDAVDQLAQSLAGMHAEKLRSRLNTLAATAGSRALYQDLDDKWSAVPELDPGTLSVAIRAARWAHQHSAGTQKVDIVWTGPATETVPIRRTEQALTEIIDGAKLELLIVSFVAYKVDQIVQALQRAMGRGVDVEIVLESAIDSGGKVSFDSLNEMKEAVPGARIYYWPLEQRKQDSKGHHGSLHAKCAVADKAFAFVSSANLTGFALELNMEIGVLIRGGDLPRRIASHFDELMIRKVLLEASHKT